MGFSNLFRNFIEKEKAGGFLLIGCTVLSLVIANTFLGEEYLQIIHTPIDLSFWGLTLNYRVEQWVNDGFMAIFFLLVGLEIKREIYVGELSILRKALLPVLAAIGGMIVPALVHLFFNAGKPTQPGFGIPMATDIAFALGILSLAGNSVPGSLKVFLAALAIIDDLGAILVIALFYTTSFSAVYFFTAIGVFVFLLVMGKLKVYQLSLYVFGGVIMWYCMLKSGVHPTVAGVLLAFVVPFKRTEKINLSYRLQHLLHKPVAFFILPVFALVNTAMILPVNILSSLMTPNSTGIILGLVIGKFGGILLTSLLAVKSGIASLPVGMTWRYLSGLAILGGIGFTMSIFISNLAFTDKETISSSIISIMVGSVLAAVIGLVVIWPPATINDRKSI